MKLCLEPIGRASAALATAALTPDQRTKLDAAQNELVGKLETILDASQLKRLLERRSADRMDFASMATPGEILALPTQFALKLSAEQRAAVAALQKEQLESPDPQMKK